MKNLQQVVCKTVGAFACGVGMIYVRYRDELLRLVYDGRRETPIHNFTTTTKRKRAKSVEKSQGSSYSSSLSLAMWRRITRQDLLTRHFPSGLVHTVPAT